MATKIVNEINVDIDDLHDWLYNSEHGYEALFQKAKEVCDTAYYLMFSNPNDNSQEEFYGAKSNVDHLRVLVSSIEGVRQLMSAGQEFK